MNRKKYGFVGLALLSAFVLTTFVACDGKETTTDDNTSNEDYVLETIEEQVLFDEAGVKVIVNGMEDSATYGKGISLTFVNSTMKALTFDCKKMIINGVMSPDLFGERVQAGESVDMVGYFGTGMLEYLGVDNVGEVILQFDCYDTENYTSVYKSDMISVKTSEYERMDSEVEFDGEKLYEDNGLTIYGKMTSDDIFEQAMLLYIENDTDSEFLFKALGLTINDVFNEQGYAFTMCENCSKLFYLEFEADELESKGITSGSTFEIDFEVYDRADLSDVFETGPLKVNMK